MGRNGANCCGGRGELVIFLGALVFASPSWSYARQGGRHVAINVFDMDDTLISTSPIYNNIRRQWASKLLGPYGVEPKKAQSVFDKTSLAMRDSELKNQRNRFPLVIQMATLSATRDKRAQDLSREQRIAPATALQILSAVDSEIVGHQVVTSPDARRLAEGFTPAVRLPECDPALVQQLRRERGDLAVSAARMANAGFYKKSRLLPRALDTLQGNTAANVVVTRGNPGVQERRMGEFLSSLDSLARSKGTSSPTIHQRYVVPDKDVEEWGKTIRKVITEELARQKVSSSAGDPLVVTIRFIGDSLAHDVQHPLQALQLESVKSFLAGNNVKLQAEGYLFEHRSPLFHRLYHKDMAPKGLDPRINQFSSLQQLMKSLSATERR